MYGFALRRMCDGIAGTQNYASPPPARMLPMVDILDEFVIENSI